MYLDEVACVAVAELDHFVPLFEEGPAKQLQWCPGVDF
jgi:hypothetical protein